jgi:hypothetical protein
MNEEQNKNSSPLGDDNQQQEPQLHNPSTEETIVPLLKQAQKQNKLQLITHNLQLRKIWKYTMPTLPEKNGPIISGSF